MMATNHDLAGRLSGSGHELAVRIYYEDTDFSGHVYHANYLKFCERGRSDFLRLKGVHHTELGDEGFNFVVRHMVCDFLRPARIDDVLAVQTAVSRMTGARLVLDQRVKREDLLLFHAEVVVALVDRSGRPRRLPARLMHTLSGSGTAGR